MELPSHVAQRLQEEFGCEFGADDGPFGAFYRTPEQSHQPALFPGPDFEFRFESRRTRAGNGAQEQHKIGAVYVTRHQKERGAQKEQTYLKIDAKFLDEPKYSHAKVLHPLPRVGELDAALDSDSRAVYFEQAAYGVPIRMALISLLLGLRRGNSLHKFEGGFEKQKAPLYNLPVDSGIRCSNANCIVHDDNERQYVRNKFYVVKNPNLTGCKLRCVYCETDIEHFVVANKRNKWYVVDAGPLLKATDLDIRDFVVFSKEAEAQTHGFHLRKHPSTTRTVA